jgi:Recombination endonuclease VII
VTSPLTCSVAGCTAPPFARGWCSKHYTRWLRHGDPNVTTRNPPSTADATEKHCPRCGNVKPIVEFGLRYSGRGAKPKGYCRDCEATYQIEHSANPEGREQHRKARSKWNASNHEYFLAYRYGISKQRYDEMLAAQGGVCAICGTDKPGGRDLVWQVDHCHNSNKIRGLLCGPCNRGLGQFRDDPIRLEAAVRYLRSKE